MKNSVVAAAAVLAMLALAPHAHAAECAAGVYHAGCAGPNGAAVVSKPPAATAPKCASGVYAAGCAGPNGAAVVRKPVTTEQCAWVNGRHVCR